MATISTGALTEASIEGVGVFDVLMQSATAHIDKEYERGRIKGGEYSQVYLGAMTAVMQQSVAFLLAKEKAGHEADLVAQEVTNATKQFEVLHSQKCKLDAEFDVLQEQKLKVIAETALMSQKKLTEEAQISGTKTDANSVIGKQKALYEAQTSGFEKDAQQKASKLMMDALAVFRTTNPDYPLLDTGLSNPEIKAVIDKMKAGIGVVV
jgi:hypothetical protein